MGGKTDVEAAERGFISDPSDKDTAYHDRVIVVTATPSPSLHRAHGCGMVRTNNEENEMTLLTNDDLATRKPSIDELEAVAAQQLTDDELALISGGGDPDDGGQLAARLHQRA
jgi:bacteriocin-like protein